MQSATRIRGHGLYPDLVERYGARHDFRTAYPRHFMEAARRERALFDVRRGHSREVRRLRGRSGLAVNVGCGPHGRPGWVNIDARPHPGVTCIFDARKRLPFEDGAVRILFAEHFLEHLDFGEEAPLFLAECFRCLEPGGVVRLVVPDAGRYVRACARLDWRALARMRPLRPGRRDAWFGCTVHTPMELLNLVFRQGGEHRFAYDEPTLARVLRLHGFRRVAAARPGRSRAAGLALDRPERFSESLYMEAERPRR